MSKYKFNINGQQFNSKKELLNHVRHNIYNKYNDNDLLSDEHFSFMLAFLHYHQDAYQKIGVGVKNMWIQTNEEYQNRGFWLERIDGTKTDFSYWKTLEKSSNLRDFKEACRRAIASLIISFKQQYFNSCNWAVCPVLGSPMTICTSHVDHTPPYTFEKIINEFVKSKNIDVEKVPLVEHNDGKIGNLFADKIFEKSWVDFHNEKAKLRVISIKANLSKLA